MEFNWCLRNDCVFFIQTDVIRTASRIVVLYSNLSGFGDKHILEVAQVENLDYMFSYI